MLRRKGYGKLSMCVKVWRAVPGITCENELQKMRSV